MRAERCRWLRTGIKQRCGFHDTINIQAAQKGEYIMMIYRAFEVKKGRNWEETYRTEDKEKIFEDLANELMNLKVFKSPVYKRLTQHNNYDGTRTVIIYQDNGRSVYRIPE